MLLGSQKMIGVIASIMLILTSTNVFAAGQDTNTVQSGTEILDSSTTTTVGDPTTTVSTGVGTSTTTTGTPTVTTTTTVDSVSVQGQPTSVTTNGEPTSVSVDGTPTTEMTTTEITTTTPVTTTTTTPTTTVTTTPVTTTETTTTTTTTSTPTTTTISTPQTTTVTTPTTTTTTNTVRTTTVTPTNAPNVLTSPDFTNELGGGTSTGWDIEACGGSGCAFSPNDGYRTSFATGRISQTFNVEDYSDRNVFINQEERGQGASFTFGAEVNNLFDNTIGSDQSTPDTWSIKLDIKAANGTVLGTQTISGGAVTKEVHSSTVHVDSGNTWDHGKITLEGVDVGFFAGFFGPRFNDVFVNLAYNEIERTISTQVLETIAFSSEITVNDCLLYTSPSPRDVEESRMPSSA